MFWLLAGELELHLVILHLLSFEWDIMMTYLIFAFKEWEGDV